MQTYEILVRERSVLPNSADMTLVRTSIGIDQVHVMFDQVHVMFDNAEWLDFPISITFGNGNTVITQSLSTSAISGGSEWVAEGTCVIPWEVIQDDTDALRVTLQGTDSDGDHIITAYGAPLKVEACGDTASGTVPQPAPTQSEWEQAYADAQAAINSLNSKLAEVDAAIAEMEEYTPQPATDTEIGLVMPDGETTTVDENGVMSAPQYALPTAASNRLGGVQVGDTLKINEFGTLNVADEFSEAQEVVDMAFDVTESGSEIASVTLKSTALPDEASDVVEAYYYDGAFYEESAHTAEITGVEGKLYIDITAGGIYRYDGSAYVQVGGSSYALPTASASTLGGIKVGSGLAIDANGVLSVNIPDGDSTSY